MNHFSPITGLAAIAAIGNSAFTNPIEESKNTRKKWRRRESRPKHVISSRTPGCNIPEQPGHKRIQKALGMTGKQLRREAKRYRRLERGRSAFQP